MWDLGKFNFISTIRVSILHIRGIILSTLRIYHEGSFRDKAFQSILLNHGETVTKHWSMAYVHDDDSQRQGQPAT